MMQTRPLLFLLLGAVCLGSGIGCQTHNPAFARRLVEHQAQVNFAGLQSTEALADLDMVGATPRNWDQQPPQANPLFVHHQWRSPTHQTGIGIVYARLPLPFSAETVLWFAQQQYLKNSATGRVLSRWTDSLDRPWFEAENEKYHVQGYAVTLGNAAWIVYFGYKTRTTPSPEELKMAARSVDTMLPVSDLRQVEGPRVAVGHGPASGG